MQDHLDGRCAALGDRVKNTCAFEKSVQNLKLWLPDKAQRCRRRTGEGAGEEATATRVGLCCAAGQRGDAGQHGGCSQGLDPVGGRGGYRWSTGDAAPSASIHNLWDLRHSQSPVAYT